MINIVIDDKKSIVRFVETLNVYWLILRIMLFQIQLKIL